MKKQYLITLITTLFLVNSIFAADNRPVDYNITEAKNLSTQDYGEEIITEICLSLFEFIFTEIAYDIFVESDLETLIEEDIHLSKSLQIPYLNNGFGRFTRSDAPQYFALDLSGSLFYQNEAYNGANSHLRFFVTPYFSLDGKYSFVRTSDNDQLENEYSFFHANLLYHRFRFTAVDFWFGPGYSELIRSGENFYGANFQMGTEIYPFKPISISTDWDFSYVGELPIAQGDLMLKVYLENLYLEGGYQYYQIGDYKIEGAKAGIGYNFF